MVMGSLVISKFWRGIMALGVAVVIWGNDPAIAAPTAVSPCHRQQEAFGFTLENLTVPIQDNSTLDLTVDYRYQDSATINPRLYPDLQAIAHTINTFFQTYPESNAYWEVVNRQLVETLLAAYPDLTSIRVDLALSKEMGPDFIPRHSTVLQTRDGACPLA